MSTDEPPIAKPGDQMILHGADLVTVDSVMVGAAPVPLSAFLSRDDHAITVVVPPGAGPSGELMVSATSSQRGTSNEIPLDYFESEPSGLRVTLPKWVGAMYVEAEVTRVNGAVFDNVPVTFEWGDGSAPTVTAPSNNTWVSRTKSYEEPGDYTITVTAPGLAPGELVVTVPNLEFPGNLLTDNECSMETDASGWAATTGAIEQTDAQAMHGRYSLRLTTATGDIDIRVVDRKRFIPGHRYQLEVHCRAGATSRTITPRFSWFNDVGIPQGGAAGIGTANNPTRWTPTRTSATSSAAATVLEVSVTIADVAPGEEHYIDLVSVIDLDAEPELPEPEPELTAVTPTSGPELTATPVTITGRGLTGANIVGFDGVGGSSLVVVDDSTVTCLTPATTTARGPRTVQVSFPAALSKPTLWREEMFEFTPAEPEPEPTVGLMVTDVTGSGFTLNLRTEVSDGRSLLGYVLEASWEQGRLSSVTGIFDNPSISVRVDLPMDAPGTYVITITETTGLLGSVDHTVTVPR